MKSRPSRRGGPYHLLLACAFLAACGDDLAAPAADAGPGGGAGDEVDAAATVADAAVMPSALRVTGVAEGGADDGERVSCIFTLDLIDLVADGAGGMSGVAVGEVFRRIFDGRAPRFEFSALVGGPATLSIGDGGAVELRLVGDQPPEAVPFWQALEVMAGSQIGPYEYAGRWACAPVLITDPMDSPIEAEGTWTALPFVVDG